MTLADRDTDLLFYFQPNNEVWNIFICFAELWHWLIHNYVYVSLLWERYRPFLNCDKFPLGRTLVPNRQVLFLLIFVKYINFIFCFWQGICFVFQFDLLFCINHLFKHLCCWFMEYKSQCSPAAIIDLPLVNSFFFV